MADWFMRGYYTSDLVAEIILSLSRNSSTCMSLVTVKGVISMYWPSCDKWPLSFLRLG